MIDNINKTEHRFDSMASIGKFGTKKVNCWDLVSKVFPSGGDKVSLRGPGWAVM